jgi:hypothetical protein
MRARPWTRVSPATALAGDIEIFLIYREALKNHR